jgi:hypothetical protein
MDAMSELVEFLNYLIGHNKNHADEITVLAGKALDLGKKSVYDDLMRGAKEINMSNESLVRALAGLKAR